MDSLPEQQYDDITRLATYICETPISMVSLLEECHQWFKSKQGLDVAGTSRDISFCGHAILQQEPLIIEDATQDERFVGNPLVEGPPHIRFYAGFPLRSPERFQLGTLCVIDHHPRQLNASQIKIMQTLARQVMSLLELHRQTYRLNQANLQLKVKQAEIIDSKRLVSLGSLAGGVAHQINNPLAIIVGKLYRLRKACKQQNEVSSQSLSTELKSLEQMTYRIQNTVNQLHAFA
jgi:GAF domain-containing protein